MIEIIDNPDYLAYRLNFNEETIEYLPISDDEIRSVAWLKHAAIDAERQLISIPLLEVKRYLAEVQIPLAAPQFIFHTAYCASTHLSRSLDVVDQTISLREPQLLLDAANAKRLQWVSKTTSLRYQELPAMALRLLQKHGNSDRKLIIKPINSVNNIIPELLQAAPQSKAIVLYTDARNFVLSALKKGESARQTLRAMFDLLRCDFPHLANLSISNAVHMSDLKLILTFWRLQIEQVELVIKQSSAQGRVASLYAEELINNPSAGMNAVDQFLELGLGNKLVTKIATGQTSKVDAKNPEKLFSKQQRDKSYSDLQRFFGEDLSNGLQWLDSNNSKTGLNPILSSPLILSP